MHLECLRRVVHRGGQQRVCFRVATTVTRSAVCGALYPQRMQTARVVTDGSPTVTTRISQPLAFASACLRA